MSRLRAILDKAVAENGYSAQDLTVLAIQNDPFRIDTPARHRDGKWFGERVAELYGQKRFHLRGLHYAVVGTSKPNGVPYSNADDKDWDWLQGHAAKAARWLGYVSFDQIIDARNDEPVVQVFEREEPWPHVTAGLNVEIPEIADITPQAWLGGFKGVQPSRLVIFGEKSSLGEVLLPISTSYRADLYLPTGEISDPQVHRMASVGAEDGRPMKVFCVSDCDPAGWQMPISIARKLQALRVLKFPDLDYEVYPVALTPDQVREYDLPSTPLKAKELRADKWRQAMGVSQTEIDALATLRPGMLRRIVSEALDPFFDRTLSRRVWAAEAEWTQRAQAAIEEQIDREQLDSLSSQARAKLNELRQEIDAINAALRDAIEGLKTPKLPEVPDPEIAECNGNSLISSDWDYVEQTRRLIAHKAYKGTTA